jgi:16S rRNA (uracil1498-N3)-methyltransferase
MPRFFCPAPLATGSELDLPPGAARHVQVLRLQPGDGITLFDGGLDAGSPGGEFEATVLRMGRSDVRVLVGVHHAIEREAPRAVHLLAGITANERMDWLIEKATELGVAACEQCGRNRVPVVHGAVDLAGWLRNAGVAAAGAPGAASPPGSAALRLLLSLREGTTALRVAAAPGGAPVVFLSGPEGGLSSAEEDLAQQQGLFAPVTLGPRVLRAETAPLAALATLTLQE